MNENKELQEKISKMTPEEFDAFLKEQAREHAISISDFIEKLKSFDQDSKICYIDCVEGAKYDLTPIKKSDLGDRFFKYVKDSKKIMIEKDNLDKKTVDGYYPYVDDDVVVVI